MNAMIAALSIFGAEAPPQAPPLADRVKILEEKMAAMEKKLSNAANVVEGVVSSAFTRGGIRHLNLGGRQMVTLAPYCVLSPFDIVIDPNLDGWQVKLTMGGIPPVAVKAEFTSPVAAKADAPTYHFPDATKMVCGPDGCYYPSAQPNAVSYPGGPYMQPIQQQQVQGDGCYTDANGRKQCPTGPQRGNGNGGGFRPFRFLRWGR